MGKRLAQKNLKERDVFKTLQIFYEKGLTPEGKPAILLSEMEEKIRVRWESAFTLLCNFHSPKQAATQMEIVYGVSQDTAMRDVRNATRLFGDVNKSSKEGKRYILYEYAMKCLMMAKDAGDLKEMNAAMSNMIKISGVDKEDLDLPDYTEEEVKQVIIQLHPTIIEMKNNKEFEAEIRKLIASKKSKKFDIEEAKIINDGGEKE